MQIPTVDRRDATTAAEQCLRGIRSLIVSRELLPGQKLHQGELSARLGMSRIPIREALAALRAQGVLDYHPNCGYVVARMDLAELYQLYRLRDLLETELLESLSEDQLATKAGLLETLLKAQTETIDRDVIRSAAFNRDFHMALFMLSPLSVILDEVRRIWDRLEFFQLPFLATVFSSDAGRAEILSAHQRIVDAAKLGNKARLVAECQDHRARGLMRLRTLLAALPTPPGLDDGRKPVAIGSPTELPHQ